MIGLSEDNAPQWQIETRNAIDSVLAERWRAIETDGRCTVFQTLDWVSTWYEAARRHNTAEPVIVTARRAGAVEVEVILPLCRVRRRGYSLLTFADIAVSDFCGPVYAADAFTSADAVSGFALALSRLAREGDAIHFKKIAPTVNGERNPLLDLNGIELFPYNLWGVALELGNASPPPSIPSATLASVTKRRSALDRKFNRTFVWEDEPERLTPLFDELVDLRLSRSNQIGREDILKEPIWRDFYRSLVSTPQHGIKPIIVRIAIDGATIATLFAVGYRNAFHYLLPTYVMKKWNRYTPGYVLILDAMEAAAERGYGYFNFSIGDAPYKEAFGGQSTPLHEAFIPLTARGRAAHAAWYASRRLRRFPRLEALVRGHRPSEEGSPRPGLA